MIKPKLTVDSLVEEAGKYAAITSTQPIPSLYGVTDGKAVGTFYELGFRAYLVEKYAFDQGNAASGIDFPTLLVDMKVTSIRQPQSSCPFKSARQKIFGLGYSILLFVYEKIDDPATQTANLVFRHTVFISSERTADFQMTRLVRETLERDGNEEDIAALLLDRNLPVDEIEAENIARDIISRPPMQGYLTVSNALQWRLQYARAVQVAGTVQGIVKIND